ncbi:MAG: proprotein convertase P-domain-containing protein [Dokdonella sp.]
MAVAVFTMIGGAGSASAAVDKAASYQQMLGLAQQMHILKPQVHNNAQAAVTYDNLENHYRNLASALGGDDPGQLGVSHAGSGSQGASSAPNGPAPPPTGCSTTSMGFTQSTPVAIPDTISVVSSTLVVSGAGPYLFDLNMMTHIRHTFPGDLDITLTSPAGTIVTITTDNAGTNDDVFNGTYWDDVANPAGQVPYTTNDGLVTDQLYAVGVLASSLVPEEAMGAFIGENPNGTWTLTISDDANIDGGSLDDWSLDVTTLPAAPTIATVPTVTNSTPLPIPDNGVTSSTIVVAGAGSAIQEVDLTTFITHTFPGDLDITLTSPAGTVVTITTDNGGTSDDAFNGTVWDDDANPGGQVPYTANNGLVTDQTYAVGVLASPLVPEEALAAFIGQDPNGTWTLTLSDDAALDTGALNSWSLDIKTYTCASSADLSITKTDGVATVAPGGVLTYTIVASNAGPGDAPGSTVADTFPAGLTCTWTCAGSGGGTCTAAGAGNIFDTANLPAGSSTTYTASCTVDAGAADGTVIVNSASVGAGTGVTDPNTGNNVAFDTTVVSAPPPPNYQPPVPLPTLKVLGMIALILSLIGIVIVRRRYN